MYRLEKWHNVWVFIGLLCETLRQIFMIIVDYHHRLMYYEHCSFKERLLVNLQWDEVMTLRALLQDHRQPWPSAFTGITPSLPHTYTVYYSDSSQCIYCVSDGERQARIRSPCWSRDPLHRHGAVTPVRTNSFTTARPAGSQVLCLNSSSPSESTSTNCKFLLSPCFVF